MYQKTDQNDLAIIDYEHAISINPAKAKAYLNLGILYLRHSRNYTEALNHLNQAIACGILFFTIEPINLKGYISRGELFEAMYRDNMWKTVNSKKIRSKKMDLATKYAIFATEDYSRAIHIRPSNYLPYLYRGRILLKQGRVEEATVDFHAAFDLNKSIAHTFIQVFL